MTRRGLHTLPILATATAVVLRPAMALAAATGGGTMPWDTPLQTLRTDLTGPTATSISFIGIVAIFAVLIFGGELNHFFRSLCYVVLLVAVLVGANTIFSALGIAGALV
jgi:type IV secretory pathway VirB2 component (pilin)